MAERRDRHLSAPFQLLAYIHLNPVSGGMVEDPVRFRWSGHREILGRVKDPITDVDEVLRLFGPTRKSARAAYTRRLKGAIQEEWIGEEPGRLPWWRLGRPPRGEEEDPAEAFGKKREMAGGVVDERPVLSVDGCLRLGCSALGVDLEKGCRSRRSALVIIVGE